MFLAAMVNSGVPRLAAARGIFHAASNCLCGAIAAVLLFCSRRQHPAAGSMQHADVPQRPARGKRKLRGADVDSLQPRTNDPLGAAVGGPLPPVSRSLQRQMEFVPGFKWPCLRKDDRSMQRRPDLRSADCARRIPWGASVRGQRVVAICSFAVLAGVCLPRLTQAGPLFDALQGEARMLCQKNMVDPAVRNTMNLMLLVAGATGAGGFFLGLQEGKRQRRTPPPLPR